MGGSTQTSTQQQHSETQPWAPAIPGLQQVLGDAKTLYQSGAGTGVYSQPRVADLGTDTLAGLQGIRDQGAADNSGAQGVSWLQNVMNAGGGVSYSGPSLDSNGLSAGTVGALGQLQGVKGVDLSALKGLDATLADPNSGVNQTATAFMNGSRDLTTQPMLEGLLSRALAPSAAETNLSGVARGDFLDPTQNPYLQAAVKAANQNADTANRGAFAQSGRYGSGSFAAAQAKAINDTDTALYANQYNQERQNQLAANTQIDTARQNGTQLGSGIVNAISGVQSTNNQQRLAGAGVAQTQTAQRAGVLSQILGGDQFNSNLDYQKAATALGTYRQGTQDAMSNEQNRVSTALQSQGQGLQAAGMLPALDALRYVPAQQQLGVGGVLQSQNQNYIDAAMQQFGEEQQMPWSNLGRYAGIVGGIGGMGGTTDSYGKTTQKTQQSLGSTLIGGLSSGLGLLGMIGSPGVGAGANILGGIFR